MKLYRILAIVLSLTMAFALAVPGNAEQDTDDNNADLSIDEMQTEIDEQFDELNAVIWEHEVLWSRLFEQEDDTVNQIYDDSIYSTYLETLLNMHKDLVSDEEYKTLTENIEKVRAIEGKLEKLEEVYSEKLESSGIRDENPAPERFPAFEGTDLEGNAVNSCELFAGNKVTVVNFWFSGCAPCVGELGELNALNEQLKEYDGAVIGINTDTLDGNQAMIDEAKYILEQMGAAYQNIWFDSSSDAGRFAGEIIGFPTTYVVDSSGKIMGQPLMGGIDYPGMMELLQAQINLALDEDSVFYASTENH